MQLWKNETHVQDHINAKGYFIVPDHFYRGKLQTEQGFHSFILPDSYYILGIQLDTVDLGNENSRNSLVQGGSVHVDSGTNGQHET